MSHEKKSMVEELISELRHQRDEIRLQLNLGGKEIKEEWSKLDDKLNTLNHRFDPLREAVEETSDDVWESLQLLGSEIRDGFRRIKDSL